MPDARQLRGRLLPALVLAVAGGAATAETAPEPPLWAYLAECSAVFEAVGKADGYAGTTEQQRVDAATASASFLAEAEKEAAAAGQIDPASDVASIMGYLRERWSNRSERILALPSNLKWIDYCGGLGRQRGILPFSN